MSTVLCVTIAKHSLQLSVTKWVSSRILFCYVILLIQDYYQTCLYNLSVSFYAKCGSLVFTFRPVCKEFNLVLPFGTHVSSFVKCVIVSKLSRFQEATYYLTEFAFLSKFLSEARLLLKWRAFLGGSLPRPVATYWADHLFKNLFPLTSLSNCQICVLVSIQLQMNLFLKCLDFLMTLSDHHFFQMKQELCWIPLLARHQKIKQKIRMKEF